jgi:ribokinase
LLVVGSINHDVSITCDRLPGAGETVFGSGFADTRGGKGANQAAAAAIAAAGAVTVAFAGAVGDDAEGLVELAALEDIGVDVEHVDRVPGARTGTAFVAVDRSGANQIIVVPGANDAVSPDRVQRTIARLQPDVVLVSLEIPQSAVEAAVFAATETNATTILNPAPAGGLRRALVTACDIVTPNEVEFRQLIDADQEVVVDELTSPGLLDKAGLARHPGVFVVTLGDRGALLLHDGQVHMIPAPVVDVVDTTGAGDVFSGVLAVRVATGAAIDAAVASAVDAASRSTMSPGARLSPAVFPDRQHEEGPE